MKSPAEGNRKSPAEGNCPYPGAGSHPRAVGIGRWGVVCLVPLLLFAAGCSSIRTRLVQPEKIVEARTGSALTGARASEATRQLLRMALLAELARDRPTQAIRSLIALYDRDWGPSGVLGPATAAAELALIEARKAENRHPREAAGFYLTAAELSLDAVSRTVRGEVSPLETRVRFAAELYNFAVGRLVALFQGPLSEDGLAVTEGTARFTGPLGSYDLRIGGDRRPFQTQIYSLQPADSIRVQGLRNRHRSRGLGAPLVVMRQMLPERALPRDGFFPSFWNFYGLTAAVRFDEVDFRARDAVPGRHREVHLTLHDPLSSEKLAFGELEMPLEADYTAPLAILTEVAREPGSGAAATLRAEDFLDETGLFLIEPYRPNKIPLVLVHGLQSTSLTWIEMANDLRADPEIRRNYQIWAFNYPTGVPFTFAATLLRESLERTIARLDPTGENPRMNEMVMVGHSLGGLLTRMQTIRSDSALWQAVSDRPLEELGLAIDDQELLRRTLFVEPLPWLSRAIFIATPHRGSRLAVGTLGRVASSLVKIPGDLEMRMARVRSAGVLLYGTDDEKASDVFDSVAPGGPILKALDQLPPQVPFHTVLGDRSQEDEGISDGVVEGWSALIGGADSERIVRSGHGVHQTPEGIAEVRRILIEHLYCSPWDLSGSARSRAEAMGEPCVAP